MKSSLATFFDNPSRPNTEQKRRTHTIFGSVLWASCWSSDVFGVAMTMVTIVRQSISNVEAEGRGGGKFESVQEDVWTHSTSISAKDFDRGGPDATRQ